MNIFEVLNILLSRKTVLIPLFLLVKLIGTEMEGAECEWVPTDWKIIWQCISITL